MRGIRECAENDETTLCVEAPLSSRDHPSVLGLDDHAAGLDLDGPSLHSHAAAPGNSETCEESEVLQGWHDLGLGVVV